MAVFQLLHSFTAFTMRCSPFHPALLIALLFASSAFAQEKDKKKEEKKPEPPVILVSYPLAMSPGQKTHMTLRGLRLNTVTNIVLVEGEKRTELKVKLKADSKPPDKYDAKLAGDTKADIDIELSAETAPGPGSVKLIAVGAGGESKPYELMVIAKDQLIAEKGPNDSFKNAQPIRRNQTILGGITGNNQVDVFSYTGKAGEKITIDVLAARLGSALDPCITLFDPDRNIIAMVDDNKGDKTGDKPSRDCTLTLTLPMDGTYLIVLQDALDRGDPAHSYLLRVAGGK